GQHHRGVGGGCARTARPRERALNKTPKQREEIHMTHAIRFSETGGPEVLKWGKIALPELGEGEVRLRQEAVGLNYIDTYHRCGMYPVPLPSGIGLEGAGTVEAVGPG
ncbi:hypothetical protein RZS08_58795, partial [Arthrospira platensis SPKY1]|nr:hypothetical protein [Arthrospira platensis SPKY1]